MSSETLRNVIETYMFGVDAKDLEALESCFAKHAVAIYHAGTPEQRVENGGLQIAGKVHASCKRFTASNHSISNFVETSAGVETSTNTFAIAHVIVGSKGLVRGLRYEDKFTKENSKWVIIERRHTPIWQNEIAITAPQFF